MLDFNKFKARLIECLKSHGLDLEASNKRTGLLVWYIDWDDNFNDSFEFELRQIKNALDLYDKALLEKDVLTTKAAILHASIKIELFSGSPFNAISRDLTRVLNDKSFNWPPLRKGYVIPNKYLDKKINGIDQEELMSLTKIQKILIDLVKSHGVTDEELKQVGKRTKRLIWGIDLNSDFNKIFYEKLLALQIAFDAYEKASIQEDWRAVRAILQRIRLINFQLYKFLDGIRVALKSAWLDKRFWPSFPENYKIPAHYNYEE